MRQEVLRRPAEGGAAAIEVVNETTLAGIARLLSRGQRPVAALNFASARNPGGGFFTGAVNVVEDDFFGVDEFLRDVGDFSGDGDGNVRHAVGVAVQ